MAARRFAWILNLDADLELAVPHGYTPKRTVLEAMKPYVARLASSLLGPGDVLVLDPLMAPAGAPAGTSPGAPAGLSKEERAGLVGRAFCPTPRALAILRRAGAAPEPHPGVEVLRRVNSRAFCASLGATLPGATFATDLEHVRAAVLAPPPVGEGWRVKRNFGMTGRGQRLVRPALGLDDADIAFLRAGFAEGGVQVEPNVRIATEYGIHGMLTSDGALTLGSVVRQRCDARGAWLATEPLTPPEPGEPREPGAPRDEEAAAALVSEAVRVAGALSENGYFGPFGIDAYTYYGPDGNMDIQVRSEINARYAMGFAIGFGRRD